MKLECQRAALLERLDKLDEAYIFAKAIDLASCERQRDKLREQVTMHEIETSEAPWKCSTWRRC